MVLFARSAHGLLRPVWDSVPEAGGGAAGAPGAHEPSHPAEQEPAEHPKEYGGTAEFQTLERSAKIQDGRQFSEGEVPAIARVAQEIVCPVPESAQAGILQPCKVHQSSMLVPFLFCGSI